MLTAQDFVLKLKLELCVKRVHPRPSLLWILAFIQSTREGDWFWYIFYGLLSYAARSSRDRTLWVFHKYTPWVACSYLYLACH